MTLMCECVLNLICQRHLSPPISNKTRTIKYNQNEMHALWACKTLHSPANAYFHVIRAVFYSIIIFYLLGNKSSFFFPVSGTKSIFMLKVMEKHSDVRKKIILVPFGQTPMTHMRRQRISSQRHWFLKAIRNILCFLQSFIFAIKSQRQTPSPYQRGGILLD